MQLLPSFGKFQFVISLNLSANQGVWCDNPNIRQAIGFAIERERGMGGAVQEFEGGIILRDDRQNFYVLFQDDQSYEQPK